MQDRHGPAPAVNPATDLPHAPRQRPKAGMFSFQQLYDAHPWRAIPNCPGRYVARDLDGRMTVAQLAGCELDDVKAFTTQRARDTVLVLKIPGGGIISYQRVDGTCLHTLNTDSGFFRKLTDLGVAC